MNSKQQLILKIAKHEVTPQGYYQFQPIVLGPWIAVLGICVVGLLSLPYLIIGLVYRRVFQHV